MAFGQLHSTGTICKARKSCPIESEGNHFNTVQELVTHTAERTGTSQEELNGVISSGVSVKEAVAMAKDGLLQGSVPSSSSKISSPKVEPDNSAKISIGSIADQSDWKTRRAFIDALSRQGYPAVAAEDNQDGTMTITVDADFDPDEYSVMMAAEAAFLESSQRAAEEQGWSEDEIEEYQENDFHLEVAMVESEDEE